MPEHADADGTPFYKALHCMERVAFPLKSLDEELFNAFDKLARQHRISTQHLFLLVLAATSTILSKNRITIDDCADGTINPLLWILGVCKVASTRINITLFHVLKLSNLSLKQHTLVQISHLVCHLSEGRLKKHATD